MNAAQLINQTSGHVEYYTPQPIIEAARRTMGAIDLDPASSAAANVRVRASCFFTKETNGLKPRWFGCVWLNHPFHAGWKACTDKCQRKSCLKVDKKTGQPRGHIYEDIPSNADWINKVLAEFHTLRFAQLCCITFAATSEKWFQPLLHQPQCYLFPRTNYWLPNGDILPGVTKGSVVTYFGKYVADFAREYAPFGVVKVRYA